jgi:hypothetical protein
LTASFSLRRKVWAHKTGLTLIVFTPKYSKESSLDATRKFCDDLYGCYLKLFLEAVNTPGVEYLAVSFLKTGKIF